jgi:hypothetical protein
MELEEYSIQRLVLDKTITLDIPTAWIGQEVNISITPAYLVESKSLVASFEELTQELWWTSETDARWTVSYQGQLDTQEALEVWVVKKLGLPSPLEQTSIDFFFKHAMIVSNAANADQVRAADHYRKVYDLCVASFEKTLVLRSGVVEKAILVVGMTAKKSVIVLSTTAVET